MRNEFYTLQFISRTPAPAGRICTLYAANLVPAPCAEISTACGSYKIRLTDQNRGFPWVVPSEEVFLQVVFEDLCKSS